MKQNLKYYIIIVLAVLLHSVTMKAANTSYIIEDPDQEECFKPLLQAGISWNAFISIVPLCPVKWGMQIFLMYQRTKVLSVLK